MRISWLSVEDVLDELLPHCEQSFTMIYWTPDHEFNIFDDKVSRV